MFHRQIGVQRDPLVCLRRFPTWKALGHRPFQDVPSCPVPLAIQECPYLDCSGMIPITHFTQRVQELKDAEAVIEGEGSVRGAPRNYSGSCRSTATCYHPGSAPGSAAQTRSRVSPSWQQDCPNRKPTSSKVLLYVVSATRISRQWGTKSRCPSPRRKVAEQSGIAAAV